MNIYEAKLKISEATGIPAHLLTGNSFAEDFEQAKNLLQLMREGEAQQHKDTREQFADWLTQSANEPGKAEAASIALEQLVSGMLDYREMYPVVRDAGDANIILPDARTPAEQFGEWVNNKLAYDPRKDQEGWIRLD